MDNYTIGIIEDTKNELLNIERTIRSNSNEKINFISYITVNVTDDDYDSFIQQIIKDISNQTISLLIIDNKLLFKNFKRLGTEIYSIIRNIAVDFPIIIMTGYRDEAFKSEYVDSDKIYDKKNFFMGRDYTLEKVNAIVRNIKCYKSLRNDIEAKVDQSIKNFVDNSNEENSEEFVRSIIENEQELQKFTPVDKSYLENYISPDRLLDILKYIEDIKKKVE